MSAPNVIVESTLKSPETRAIRFSGRFDRRSSSELFAAFQSAIDDDTREIEIDLGNVYHIDNAALGMMFKLRDKARGAGKIVSVVYP